MMMKHRLLAAAVLGAAPSFATAQVAADVAATPAPTAQQPDVASAAVTNPEVAEQVSPNTGAFHFGFDLVYTTSYFFRGYNQEDTGAIIQPNVYATFNAITSDDLTLDFKVGSWNSLQSKQTLSDGVWYESDLYAIATVGLGDFKVNTIYTLYTYPDDAFEAIHEVGVSFNYNETKLWEKAGVEGFTLAPEIGVYFETDDGNGTNDIYAEAKLTPGFDIKRDDLPYIGKGRVSFPIVLGTSFDRYYLDAGGGESFFGYIQGGVALSVPLDFIPAKYGTWSAYGGVNYIQLLANSARVANDGGTNYEVQGMAGVSMAY